MKLIPRIYGNLGKLLRENKVIVIYGPRRVGKTTLLNNFLKKTLLKYAFHTGDEISVREALTSESIDTIKNFISGSELIVIDEAQRIPDIGLGLKLIVDNFPGIKVLISGS